MTKNALIVYKPKGKSTPETDLWIGKVAHELAEKGDYLTTILTLPDQKDEIISHLKPPLDLVIAAGGDGTVRRVLSALSQAKSDIPAAILPLGTFNVMARNLGIVEERFFALPPEHAVDTILEGKPILIDLGQANDNHFCVAAGVGPMSDAFFIPKRKAKRKFKLAAYAGSLLASIAAPPIKFRITTEKTSFEVISAGILITNIHDLGLGKPSDIGALADGLLRVNVLCPKTLRDYVAIVLHYASGLNPSNMPSYTFEAKKVLIEVVATHCRLSPWQWFFYKAAMTLKGNPLAQPKLLREVPIMIDGKEGRTTPLNVKVVPESVRVIAAPDRVSQMKAKAEISKLR
ncbi:MAG: hypothetical protein K2Y22_02985 [Candidatus Obscuribacterales bacterium]|nr:hypothetical protein [Candidatus Obscuribacterales bacterium]